MGRVRTVAAKKYHESDDNSDEEVLAKKPKNDVTPSKRRASGRVATTPKSTPQAKATPSSQRSSGRLQRGAAAAAEKDEVAPSSSSESSSEEEDEAPAPAEKPKKAENGVAKPGLKRGRKPNKKDEEKEDHYEVEDILDHKIEDGQKYFYIRWKGYDASADSWQRQRDIKCPALVGKYYEKHPEAQSRVVLSKKKKKIKTPIIRKLKIDEEPDYDDKWDEAEDFEVKRILDVIVHRNNKREFLIRWKGYSSNSDSWEPEENLNCRDLIENFMDKVNAAKNTLAPDLRPVRAPTQRFTLATRDTGRRLSKRNFGRQRANYYDCDE